VIERQIAARTAMSLRLFLSAIAPQIGAMIPEIAKEIAKMIPLQRFTSSCATLSS
jgi:hypothetical protein